MLRRRGLDAGAKVGKGRHRGRGGQNEEQYVADAETVTQNSKGWEDGRGATSCSPEDGDVM